MDDFHSEVINQGSSRGELLVSIFTNSLFGSVKGTLIEQRERERERAKRAAFTGLVPLTHLQIRGSFQEKVDFLRYVQF